MRSWDVSRFAALVLVLAGTILPGCEVAVSSFNVEQRESWTRDYTLAADGRLELANTNGRITVGPSPDDRVHVVADKVATAGTDQAARERLKQIEIVETSAGGRLRLETKMPSTNLFRGGASVTYTLQVPATIHVKVENTNGAVEINDVQNAVDVTTTNGRIEGRALGGAVRAHTTNGGVELELATIAANGVEASTTNGAVTLTVPADGKADVSASCVNGRINTSALALETVESSCRRVEGRLNGGGPRVSAATINGGIRFLTR
jgi:hypothetical protein